MGAARSSNELRRHGAKARSELSSLRSISLSPNSANVRRVSPVRGSMLARCIRPTKCPKCDLATRARSSRCPLGPMRNDRDCGAGRQSSPCSTITLPAETTYIRIPVPYFLFRETSPHATLDNPGLHNLSSWYGAFSRPSPPKRTRRFFSPKLGLSSPRALPKRAPLLRFRREQL